MGQKAKKYSITKVWEKTNKKHYPDPDWVWNQIENKDVKLTEAMDVKYALKKHGNTGNPGNRWKNNNNNK